MVLKPEPLFESHRVPRHRAQISPRPDARIRHSALRPGREVYPGHSPPTRPPSNASSSSAAATKASTSASTSSLCDRELSIGDYVLSGGELAAAVILDATMRLLPGVLGNEAPRATRASASPTRLRRATTEGRPRSTHGSGGLLDYPHYTRPAEFRGTAVPEVLAGGDHDQIRRWRRQRALEKTLRNRPDLLEEANLCAEDRKLFWTLE